MKLAEKVIYSFTEFFEGELDAMEEEILSYAQQIILQKFDFLTADLVQQEFDQPENIKVVREELKKDIKENMHMTSSKSDYKAWFLERKMPTWSNKKISLECSAVAEFLNIIDRKAIEIKKDNLN